MTRAEFLTAKRREKAEGYHGKHADFYANPSVARIEPFKIADGLYYVGDKSVCVHMIDTGDGLILLDSGFLGAEHLLIDSIWRMGFDPANVRYIIHSHGHSDHFGASSEFKNMFGTKLAISRIDAEMLRRRADKAIARSIYPFAKLPEFDLEFEDGDVFELGNVKIRFVLTPGHTAGVLSMFFEVTDNGKTYLAGMFGGAGVNALSLPYMFCNESGYDCPRQMLASIEKVWDEPVVVHIGNHPYNSKTMEKRAQQLAEGGNPFVAPDSWHSFLSELKGKVEKVMADNEQLEKEMEALGCK